MQTYIGVKLLEAKPMTRGEYNAYKNWAIPTNENPNDEGYLVQYNPTYESWSPKDVFEAAYLPLTVPTAITPGDLANITAKITSTQVDEKTTLVNKKLVTGFEMYATSSCVDPLNYSDELGRKYGEEEINKKLWFALGFVLQWAKYGLKKVTKQ